MSIIEKALSKQRNANQAKREPQSDDDFGKRPLSRVEQAMARVGERSGYRPVANATAAADSEQSAEKGAPVADAAPVRTRRSAEISRIRLEQFGLLRPEGGHNQVAEEFRLIKRPLLGNAFATGEEAVPQGNLVMVTSSLPREGKTFCTINLAMSIAMEFERTVLLVDADVARPSILEYLGIEEDGPGLLDLLADDSIDFPDALIRTDIESLSILPAGKTYPRANEMLASASMQRLVKEMSSRYPDRIILFDTPPLLATSEASVLAGYMGQIVFVVEADKTPEDATVRAIEQLERCEIVMPLLNKSVPLPGKRYAHGYYGSYHGRE